MSPKHTAASVYVRVKVYRSSGHKWKLYKTLTAKNCDYRTGTRYKASVKLRRGTYHVYAYAGADQYHLATTSSCRTVKVK